MSTRIPEINIQERFEIKGRGTMYTASQAENSDVRLDKLAGKTVRIAGVAYRVTGVEMSEKNGKIQDGAGLVVVPWMVS